MAQTAFRHLSNAELVRHVSEIRTKSPIIEELTIRLENLLQRTEGATWSADCPVCAALLNIEVSDDGDEVEVKAA